MKGREEEGRKGKKKKGRIKEIRGGEERRKEGEEKGRREWMKKMSGRKEKNMPPTEIEPVAPRVYCCTRRYELATNVYNRK